MPTPPRLTDDAVSHLPLAAGRAELLEEIMQTVAPDRPTPELVSTGRRRRRAWLVPAAAAAVVAGLAVTSVWWGSGPGDLGGGQEHAAADRPSPGSGYRAVLDAPGWSVTSTESDAPYGEIDYAKGDQSFQITWYGASSYADYVDDREHIVDPPAAGAPLEVLGVPAQMWAYDDQDHTAIRQVDEGHWMEVRGSGMDSVAYLGLVGQLRLVDDAGFEAALPARFVTQDERAATIGDMLTGIEQASGAGWPGTAPTMSSTESDPYQLGAYVAGRYACAWIGAYADATSSGDTAAATEAARVLGTSRQWPVLQQMQAEGGFSQSIWEQSDQVARGQVPTGYKQGIGC